MDGFYVLLISLSKYYLHFMVIVDFIKYFLPTLTILSVIFTHELR